jgi:hypothetical protein
MPAMILPFQLYEWGASSGAITLFQQQEPRAIHFSQTKRI